MWLRIYALFITEGLGWVKVLLYLGIWGTTSLVPYAAVTHTTFLGGEERVVRMTSTSEGSEWDVGITFQACQGTGVVLELEEVPPRDQ